MIFISGAPLLPCADGPLPSASTNSRKMGGKFHLRKLSKKVLKHYRPFWAVKAF